MTDERPSIFWRWFIGTALVLTVALSVHIHRALLNALHPPRPSEPVKSKP